MNKANQYIEELNCIDEHIKIEAKLCSDKIDKSVLETICSFSNEPDLGGGVIILGIKESGNDALPYVIVGVKDADKLQKDLATQCASMFNHPVRPLIKVEPIEGKTVIIVEVSELDSRLKPLYFKDTGLPKGAWRRIGSTDHRCTEEDLPVLFHESDHFDIAAANGSELEDIDENALRYYRRLRSEVNPKAEELNYSDFDLLRSLNCITKSKDGDWKLTNTGLLVFGKAKALRREFPAVRVDYIRVSGKEWLPDPYQRFESIDLRGSLLLMVNRAFNAVVDDLPRGFSLKPGNLQADRPLPVPEGALREAIVNSLIHQNFRIHQPIQIIRYSNRIEIVNPGFSLKPAEMLGEPGSRLRNPTISAIFHDTQLAEAKGTGIGAMRRLMKEAAMMPPTFESDHARNCFTARILLHHFLSDEDLRWLRSLEMENMSDTLKVALVFLKEVGAIDNVSYRQLSGESAKDSAKGLRTLINLGLIEVRGQGRYTYYLPTDKLRSSYSSNGASSDTNGASSDTNGASSDTNGASSDVFDASISQKLESLGKRASKMELEEVIVGMCRVRPLSVDQIANYTKRTINHIRNKVLPDLLRNQRLVFTIPDMVNHPNQKYRAK